MSYRHKSPSTSTRILNYTYYYYYYIKLYIIIGPVLSVVRFFYIFCLYLFIYFANPPLVTAENGVSAFSIRFVNAYNYDI